MIRFRKPAPAPVVLLYADREELFREWILKEIPYRVVTVGGWLCLHPLVLLRTLRLLPTIDWHYVRFERNPLVGLVKQLYERHLQAYIEAIKPRVVMTWVDDSGVFHRLSRNYHGADFFAVQNGLRLRWYLDDSLPAPPHPGAVVSMPNFFCFGESDVELYRQRGHRIDRFFPIGSLVGGIYWGEFAGEREIHYDLCYISQWEHWASSDGVFKDDAVGKLRRAVFDGFGVLEANLRRLVDEKGYSLLIALRQENCPEEQAYFRQRFGDQVAFQPYCRKTFSTYRAIDQAKLIINLISTCGAEAMGVGRRVLFCNGSGDTSIGLPEAGYCYFEGGEFDAFKERVERLLSMSDEAYQALAGGSARRLMNYDFSSMPQERLRREVLSSLDGQENRA